MKYLVLMGRILFAAQTQYIMFMKDLSMLGGTLLIAYFGSGPFSLDDRKKISC